VEENGDSHRAEDPPLLQALGIGMDS